MLEWTVCKNCGTILDNSQNICSNCKSNVEKVDIDYLRNYLNNLNFILKTLDIFTPYSSMEQLKNNSLEDIIQKDLFNYFSYLGWGDGKITDNELEFINLILDKNFTKEDITKQNIDEIPVSFSCLKEIDDVAQNLDMCQVDSCNELFSCFKIFGKFFITVDDDLNEDVLKLYANYISKLESTLTNENITLKPAKLPDSDEINKQEDQHSLEEYLDELNKLVYTRDVTTLLGDGLEKIIDGITTFSEIFKLIEVDLELKSLKKKAAEKFGEVENEVVNTPPPVVNNPVNVAPPIQQETKVDDAELIIDEPVNQANVDITTPSVDRVVPIEAPTLEINSNQVNNVGTINQAPANPYTFVPSQNIPDASDDQIIDIIDEPVNPAVPPVPPVSPIPQDPMHAYSNQTNNVN